MTSFLAQKTSNQNGATGTGSFATYKYDSSLYDNQGEYNPSTGIFTAKTPGKRSFSCTLFMSGLGASNTNCGAAFVRNGSEYHHFSVLNGANSRADTGGLGLSGSISLFLNTGDTVQVQAYSGGSSLSVNFDSGANSMLSGQKLE